jgi:HTH-type transcriptional regulator/antitoxin HipB
MVLKMLIKSTKELAAFVRDHRKQSELTQTEIASRVGLKQATLSSFETHPDATRIKTLFSILAALDLEMHLVKKGDSEAKSSKNDTEW